jgi:hypothetical protein
MVPVGTAFIIFQQTFGGAFFLAIGQTLFNSSLGDALRRFAPLVDAETVIHAGASDVRDVVTGPELPAVINAFAEAVSHEFYFALAMSSLTVFSALGMGWIRVPKKQTAKKEESEKTEQASKAEVKSEV